MHGNRSWRVGLCLAAVLLCGSVARADYEAGQTAWQAGRPAEALTQWRAAARDGDTRAMLALGLAYVKGLGVPQDFVEAHKWLNLAAGRGNAEAADEREALAAKMTAEERAEAQRLARAWRKAAIEPKPAAPTTAPSSPAGPPPRAIKEAQELMAALGYEPGPADGRWGSRSASAYAAFLRDAGLPPGNVLTPDALRAMRAAAEGRTVAETAASPRQAPATQPKAAPPPADLHRLVAAGDIDGLKKALAAGADANARDGKGWTALMYAADKGRTLLVPPLLKAGADPNTRASDGATALFMAAVHGHSEIITALTKAGADPSIEGPKGMTAEKLFAARIVKEKYNRKPNALHKALRANETPAVIKAMLELGFDANELNEDGYTPLLWLAEKFYDTGDNDLIELLIEGGADVNFKSRYLKVTPLHIAVDFGRYNMVSALLDHGAKVDSIDANGATPLYYLADKAPKISDLVAIAKQLLDHGADINNRAHSVSPLERSLWTCDRMKLSKFLLDRGADVRQRNNSQGKPGSTALHHAAECDRSGKITDLLLSRGLDINVQTYKGRTPLFEAVSDHNLPMVKYLLDRGADPTIKGVAQFPYMKTIPYGGYEHPRVTPLENARRARKYWKEEGHPSMAAGYDGVIDLLSNASSSNSRENAQGSSDEEQYGYGD